MGFYSEKNTHGTVVAVEATSDNTWAVGIIQHYMQALKYRHGGLGHSYLPIWQYFVFRATETGELRT